MLPAMTQTDWLPPFSFLEQLTAPDPQETLDIQRY
jgi:hypothetical protein